MRPYFIPERNRTKSETIESSINNDNLCMGYIPSPLHSVHAGLTQNTNMMDTSCDTNGILAEPNGNNMLQSSLIGACGYSEDIGAKAIIGTTVTPSTTVHRPPIIKKSRSLEDLSKANKSFDGSQSAHEMEFVSSRIQKLKFQD